MGEEEEEEEEETRSPASKNKSDVHEHTEPPRKVK
jgi:hypothetical protein